MNVVSLLPSSTEILYALGVEPVGVSHECDYPPQASEKPSLTTSRVDPEGSSQEINQRVADSVDEGGVYDLDVERLDSLEPDVVITQGVCDVCAVDSSLVEDAVDGIDSKPEVVNLHPHTLDEVVEDVRRVGEAVGKESRSEEVVSNLRDRIENVRRKTDGFESRRVAVLDWLDPVMVAGHWVPEMIEIAGGEYGMAEPGDRSEPREWSEVLSYSPEVLVAAPCGFDLRQTVENFDDLSEREGYGDLPAVRHRRVYAMDGHNYVNRPGPRIVDSLEYFAQILHPEEFGKPPHSVAQSPVRIR